MVPIVTAVLYQAIDIDQLFRKIYTSLKRKCKHFDGFFVTDEMCVHNESIL